MRFVLYTDYTLSSSMSNQAWKNFKQNMKDKRMAKGRKKERSAVLKSGELVVQRLSSTVTGKAQKYSRVGPREFVSFPHEEMTIQNIKSSCEKHFASVVGSGLACDVLAGDQGPSCQSLDQLPDTKVIHVRFIESVDTELDPGEGPSEPKRRKGAISYAGSPSKSVPAFSRKYMPPKQFPKSLSISKMLKLGKTIEETATVIEVFTFDLEALSWSKEPDRVEFSVAKTPFASGGFRKAYKATSRDKKFAGKQWVLKRYLPETQKTIEEMGDTEESHTKKVVQMHHLAAHMAMNLSTVVEKAKKQQHFGQTFQYGNIFLGKIENEYVTLEEFISGEFIKYMNNTGEVCGEPSDEFCQKAECLSHFSFQKSDRKLMVVDIQGSGANLYDPEIASVQQMSDDGKVLFCAGNLSKEAIDKFTLLHVCNKYCKMIELEPFIPMDDSLE